MNTYAAINRHNNSVVEVVTAESLPTHGDNPWMSAPPETKITPYTTTPGDRAPEPGEWGWSPSSAAVEIIKEPDIDTRRKDTLILFRREVDNHLWEGIQIGTDWFSISLNATQGSTSTAATVYQIKTATGTATMPDGSLSWEKRDRDKVKVMLSADQWADLYKRGWEHAANTEAEMTRISDEIKVSDNPEAVDRTLPTPPPEPV